MKTGNLLKVLFTGMAMFLFVSAGLSQTSVPYAEMTADTTQLDSVTQGAKMVYYVEPDRALNSPSGNYDTSYTRTEATTNGWNSSWSWTVNIGNGRSTVASGWTNEPPYKVVRFPNTGTGSIQVQELSQGGCTGNTTTQEVEVVSQPDFTVGANDGTPDDQVCSGATRDISLSGITVGGTGGKIYLRLDVDAYVDTDADNTFNDDSLATFQTHTDTIIKLLNPAGSNYTGTTTLISGFSLDAINGQPTQYRFDLGSTIANTSSTNGINDLISRKSDYFENGLGASNADSDYTYYQSTNGTDATRVLTYIAYPRPETGNIYHISNREFKQ